MKGEEGVWKPTELKEVELNGSFSVSMNQICFFF